MLTPHIDDLRASGNNACESARTRNDFTGNSSSPEPRADQSHPHSNQMLSNQDALKDPFQSCEQGGLNG